MATTKDFIEYVCGAIRVPDEIRYRKMFGEYMVYRNENPVLLVCDDTVFVKKLPETRAILGEGAQTGYPYDGAKEHFVIDPDDGELFNEVIAAMGKATGKIRKGSL